MSDQNAGKKVIFKGGTSGCAKDYKPPEVAQVPQPVLDTSRNGGYQSDVMFTSEHSKSTHKGINTAIPDVPSGAKPRQKDVQNSPLEDIQQQEIASPDYGLIKPMADVRRQIP